MYKILFWQWSMDTAIPEPNGSRQVWNKNYGYESRRWQILSNVQPYSLLQNDNHYNHVFKAERINVPEVYNVSIL